MTWQSQYDQLETRLTDKIVLDPSGCWLWTGARTSTGYANVRVGDRVRRAHRYIYELLCGTIPEGKELDHLCRVIHCVNPSHLEPVTHRENMLRGVSLAAQNARKTHCKRGHELLPSNLLKRNDGHRDCKTCWRLRRAGLL